MKIFRLVDEKGYFLEDVALEKKSKIIKETVIKEGVIEEEGVIEYFYETSSFHIDKDVPASYLKAKWNFETEEWEDELKSEADTLKLTEARDIKLREINDQKKKRQSNPVEVRGVLFNGGRTAAQKYDEAFRLAKMMGLKEGTFAAADGSMLTVDEAYATEVIVAIASTSYQLWAKEQQYIALVMSASTITEIEAITWED